MKYSLLLLLLVAGCASNPQVITETKTVTVKEPVPVPCVRKADIPSVPVRINPPKTASVANKAAAVSADLIAYQDYATKADALLRQCAE